MKESRRRRRPVRQPVRERAPGDTVVDANEELREVYLIGTVNAEMAAGAIKALRDFDATPGEITVVIASTGGEEGAGWAMYDAILLCKNKTVARVYGECQSIAALVLQACDRRTMSPNARFMIHNGNIEMSITTNQMAPYSQEVKTLSSKYHSVLAERSGRPLKAVEEMCEAETFMSAPEAVENGFADEVIVKPAARRPSRQKKVKS